MKFNSLNKFLNEFFWNIDCSKLSPYFLWLSLPHGLCFKSIMPVLKHWNRDPRKWCRKVLSVVAASGTDRRLIGPRSRRKFSAEWSNHAQYWRHKQPIEPRRHRQQVGRESKRVLIKTPASPAIWPDLRAAELSSISINPSIWISPLAHRYSASRAAANECGDQQKSQFIFKASVASALAPTVPLSPIKM